jgi:hypothetical protein
MDLASTDRVLLLGIEQADEIRAIAERVTGGIVVSVMDRDAVYDARRSLLDRSNVMIVPAEGDGTLPWKENFFSVVYAPAAAEPSGEMMRVLQPGGAAWVAAGPVVKR